MDTPHYSSSNVVGTSSPCGLSTYKTLYLSYVKCKTTPINRVVAT